VHTGGGIYEKWRRHAQGGQCDRGRVLEKGQEVWERDFVSLLCSIAVRLVVTVAVLNFSNNIVLPIIKLMCLNNVGLSLAAASR